MTSRRMERWVVLLPVLWEDGAQEKATDAPENVAASPASGRVMSEVMRLVGGGYRVGERKWDAAV